MSDTFQYADLYDRLREHGYHEQEDETSHLAPYVAWLKERLRYRSALDVGCSAGGSLPLLGSEGEVVAGVDVSPLAVQKGRRLGRSIVCASATTLPFGDDSFDLVVSADVFEHLSEDDAEAAVNEAVRIARKHVFMKIAQHEDATVKWKELAGHPLHLTTHPIEWWMEFFKPHGKFIRHEPYVFCLELTGVSS